MKDIAPAKMVENVSDTLTAAQDDFALPEPLHEDLERRLQSYRQNPQPVSSWQEASQRIRIATSN